MLREQQIIRAAVELTKQSTLSPRAIGYRLRSLSLSALMLTGPASNQHPNQHQHQQQHPQHPHTTQRTNTTDLALRSAKDAPKQSPVVHWLKVMWYRLSDRMQEQQKHRALMFGHGYDGNGPSGDHGNGYGGDHGNGKERGIYNVRI